MALRKITDDELAAEWERTRSPAKIAKKYDMHVRAVVTRLRRLGVPPLERASDAIEPQPERITGAFRIAELPDETLPITDLVAHRKKVAERTIAAYKARELIRVDVKMRGPIVLAAIGDPHVDDNGCDWQQLDADLALIDKTAGMYAVHVGDVTNNWSGRLMHLWAQQSTSAAEAIRLAEYVLTRTEPLIVVTGNHDAWPGPLQGVVQRVMRGRPGLVSDAGARVEFAFPGGAMMRMHVRHDFPGRSMYASTHGMRRELREGFRDHLMIAGHLHCDEVQITPVETDGIVSMMARVSGYKVADHWAAERRFVSRRMAPSLFVLVDPDARRPADMLKPYWCGEEAADILAYKRRRQRAA